MTCVKRAYPSKKSATKALRSTQRRGRRVGRRKEEVVYQCPMCRLWHLASRLGGR